MVGAAKLRTFLSTASRKKRTFICALKRTGQLGVCPARNRIRTWSYSGGVELLLAAIENGVCFIDMAEEYGTEEIAGKTIEGQRDGSRRPAASEFQGP
jgi:diketogulonate reductase-like aldo/keto reductase